MRISFITILVLDFPFFHIQFTVGYYRVAFLMYSFVFTGLALHNSPVHEECHEKQ